MLTKEEKEKEIRKYNNFERSHAPFKAFGFLLKWAFRLAIFFCILYLLIEWSRDY